MKKSIKSVAFILLSLASISLDCFAQQKKPNILVIWGDDIGWENVNS